MTEHKELKHEGFPTQPVSDSEIVMPSDSHGVGWIEQLVRLYTSRICEDFEAGCLNIDIQRRLRQFNDQVERLSQQQWRKFDKEDETTWPPRGLQVWIVCQNRTEPQIAWRYSERFQNHIASWDPSHWQPIQVPLPPEEEKAAS